MKVKEWNLSAVKQKCSPLNHNAKLQKLLTNYPDNIHFLIVLNFNLAKLCETAGNCKVKNSNNGQNRALLLSLTPPPSQNLNHQRPINGAEITQTENPPSPLLFMKNRSEFNDVCIERKNPRLITIKSYDQVFCATLNMS